MPEILFQPRTNLQLADFAVAGKHARMIAAGKMKGCDAYGLLDEL